MVAPAGQTGELARWCAQALESRGAQAALAPAFRMSQPLRMSSLRRGGVWRGRPADVTEISGVLSLLAFGRDPLPAHPMVPAGLAGTQGLVQALGYAGIGAPLWVLTRGAVAAGDR